MATEPPRRPRRKQELPEAMRLHQWTSTKDRREAFLGLIADGRTTTQAQAEMDPPVPYDTFVSWKKRYPEFRGRLAQLQGAKWVDRVPEETALGPDSTFAERRRVYFGYRTYWHHAEMIQAIETSPAGGVTLVLLPPDHGKSTVVQDWISDRIARNPNVRIIYLTGGLDLARKAIGRQQGRLDANGAKRHGRFHLDYGPFVEPGRDGKPWAADHFTVLKATHDEQDYTMEARSWTSKIAGTRVDDLVIDDIQELSSAEQTKQMVDRFRQDFQSRVRRLGRTIIIGTRVADDDFYNALIEAGLVNKLVMLPATDQTLVDRCELDILADHWPSLTHQQKRTLRKIATELQDREVLDADDPRGIHADSVKAWMAQPLPVRQALLQLRPEEEVHGCELVDKDGGPVPHERPLCPEMWPPHALAVKRNNVGEDAWWRNFQQKPKNALDKVFPQELVESARARLLPYADTFAKMPRWRRFAGLDPSLTGGNSLVVCESDGWRLRPLFVRRDFRLTRTEAILDVIEAGWRDWRFTDLTIEENAFQKGLVNDQRLALMARNCGFRLHPHTTGINKADRQFGVASMAAMFRDDMIEWAWGDREAQQMFAPLEAELQAWRGDVPTRKLRQDLVMALWFCWLWWQKRRRSWMDENASETAERFRNPRHLPWKPGGYRELVQLSRSLP